MAWNEIDRMYRMHAGVRAPLPAPLTVGEKIRVSRLRRAPGTFNTTFTKKPYEAIVTGIEWRNEGHNGQWHITEEHTTRRGNTVTSTHLGASTKIQRFSEERARRIEKMYGPEQPPFTKGEHIRYSYRPHAQYWIPAIIEEIEITSFLNEPRWAFTVMDVGSGRRTHIDYGMFNIERMSSKRHLPY